MKNYYVINTFHTRNVGIIAPIVENLKAEGLEVRFETGWTPISHCHWVKVYSKCTSANRNAAHQLARKIISRGGGACSIYEPLDKPRKEMVIPA